MALTWKVIAGDGVGPVTISIDSAGGTAFTAIGTSSTSITSTGVFQLLGITLPSTQTCTGGTSGNLCTLQAKSSSKWYSCTSFALTSSSPTGTTGSTTGTGTGSMLSSTGSSTMCNTAPALPFCSEIQGQSIDASINPQLLPASISDWDTTVNGTYNQNLNSPLVFTHQHNDDCRNAYKRFLCAFSFPLCGTTTTGVCSVSCDLFESACGINATHSGLYNCSQHTTTSADSWGLCTGYNGSTRMTSSFLLLSISALVAFFASRNR